MALRTQARPAHCRSSPLSRLPRAVDGRLHIDIIGTWMQKVAQSWLVLELTDSAWYLALDSFVGEAPLLLFTLIGVVADRRDRRKLLLASQVVQMSSAFTLALLVLFGHVTICKSSRCRSLRGAAGPSAVRRISR